MNGFDKNNHFNEHCDQTCYYISVFTKSTYYDYLIRFGDVKYANDHNVTIYKYSIN